MSRRASLARLGRTLQHLEPSQVLSRAREPFVDALDWGGASVAGPTTVPGWPAKFAPTDVRLGSRHVGPTGRDITLLGVKRTMGPPISWDWTAPDAPRLWGFHLNYWDWAHEVKTRNSGLDMLEDLFLGWISRTRYGAGDEWEPYVVSLRLWNLCALHRPDEEALGGKALIRSVAQQQHYLSRRLELDVRGNHLIKNFKALCGAAAFLGQDRRLRVELRRAYREIDQQVLSDGGHEERSPAYHVQVLQDVIDLRDLALSCGEEAAARGLTRVASHMLAWLGEMTMGGSLPLLNDGFAVSPDLIALLGVHQRDPQEGVTVMAESGYARVRMGRWDNLLDVGPLGPSYNPGHGHADSLSFVSFHGGAPLLIDTGTSTYAAGKQRAYERSTRAHNTVEVDGCDSSEVWGSFRVGRRAAAALTKVHGRPGAVEVSAFHNGYDATHGVGVERTWTVLVDRLIIADELHMTAGTKTPMATTHLHLHPDYRWNGTVATGPAGSFTITCRDDLGVSVPAETRMGPVADGLDSVTAGVHLQFRWRAGASRHTTTIEVGFGERTQGESQ